MERPPAKGVRFGKVDRDRGEIASIEGDVLPALCRAGYDEGMSKDVIDDAYNLALKCSQLEIDWRARRAWMFQLARRLGSYFERSEWRKARRELVPVALFFVEVLTGEIELPCDEYDWRNPEEVAIAFEAAWLAMKYSDDEDLVGVALSKAEEQPMIEEGGRVFSLLVSTAYYLQKESKSGTFFLAVSEDNERRFRCSKAMLSSCFLIALQKGYFEQVDDAVPHHKARTFKCDQGRIDRWKSSYEAARLAAR